MTDPAGDVATTPIEGFTPMGPASWADLLGVTFAVTKGDHLTVTVQTADLPDASSSAAMWGVDGSVRLPNGHKLRFDAWIDSNGVDYGGVGSKACKSSGTVSPATNTVVLEVDLKKCVPGRAVLRLRGKGTVKATRTTGEDTYLKPTYTDDTGFKNLQLK